MLDRKFWKGIRTNIIARYREAIFDLDGKGAKARDVLGKRYKPYTTQYNKAKKKGTLYRQMTTQRNSNAPVLTGDLAESFQFMKFLKNGFAFGTTTEGGKVKVLEKERPITTKTKAIPDVVSDYTEKQAKKYVDKKLKKQFKGSRTKIG